MVVITKVETGLLWTSGEYSSEMLKNVSHTRAVPPQQGITQSKNISSIKGENLGA